MITDEERHDVAEDLRNLAIGHFIQYKEQFFDELAEVVVGFEDYHDFNVVLEKLADLIDRPTCRDVADFDSESFKCQRCGFRVLSIDGAPDAAKLVGTKGGVVDFGYCPNCGAEVAE